MSLIDHTEEMKAMYAKGYSMVDIAEFFGTSRQRVHQLISGSYEKAHYGKLRKETYETNLRAAYARIRDGKSTVESEAQLMEIKPDSLRVAFRLRKLALPRRESPLHGTYYRYQEGCRCEECAKARREMQRLRYERGPRVHGTASAYVNYGCRCDACRAAGSQANRRALERRKQRKRQAVPLD